MTGATMNAAGLAMQQLEPFLTELRPELHRYCSRLLGSVIEGEDLVQDVMIRAMGAAEAADQPGNLRAWAFKVAHNRAIDLLRSRGLRHTEPIDVALDVEDLLEPDPLETVLREEAVRIALARFLELPVNQRSVVILKDILDEPIAGIAEMLGLTTDSVKAHLARGRAVLKRAAEHPELPPARPATSPEVARYVALFNDREWGALRNLLAQDVKLNQSHRPRLAGAKVVGQFFTFYSQKEPVSLAPGWMDGREVIWSGTIRLHYRTISCGSSGEMAQSASSTIIGMPRI